MVATGAGSFDQLLRLLLIELLLCSFDQSQHIAHSENSRRHPVGAKTRVGALLADADVMAAPDRLAHRKRRTAARIAVELGQDDAVDVQGVVESLATFTASWPVIASTARITS